MAEGGKSNEELLPKWEHSKQRGKLERRRLGQYGQKIHELYNPRLGIINAYEDFGDTSRYTYHLRQETAGSDLEQFHKVVGKATPFAVSFNDHDDKSTITVESAPDKANINIFLGANSSTSVNELEANVSLLYNEDCLEMCIVQADKPHFNGSESGDERISRAEARGLVENIRYLANAIATTDSDILCMEKTINRENAQDDVKKFSPDSPAVIAAEYLVSRAIYELIKSIPLDDRKEYVDSLDKIAFPDLLLHEIFLHVEAKNDVEVMIAKIDIKELLASTIAGACDTIDYSNESAMKNFQKLFQIDKFGDTSFDWRDIDKEYDIDPETDQKNIDVKQKSSTSYGQKIDIQEYSYLVTKNNNWIVVVCASNDGKQKWTATFPISIPVKQIKDIINDTSADFRKVKPLANANFKSN